MKFAKNEVTLITLIVYRLESTVLNKKKIAHETDGNFDKISTNSLKAKKAT